MFVMVSVSLYQQTRRDSDMKVLILITLLPLAYTHPSHGYGHPAPYGGYQPQPYGGYHKPAYEKPKHNCSVEDATEYGEVCTPSLVTNCENIDIPVKKIVDGEYCYDAVNTVCTESTETIDNEVCTYNYNKKYEDVSGKTVEVKFERRSNVQMVTVCQPPPSYGYGHQSYGQQYCKEVAQETSYNVPVVNSVNVPVRVGFPEAVRTCENRPITIPTLSCETQSEQKCVNQPRVEDATESVEKCTVTFGPPDCQRIELTLPKQVCKEIVYGYAEDKPKSYAPAPSPTYPKPEPTPSPSYPSPSPTYPSPSSTTPTPTYVQSQPVTRKYQN